MTRDDERMSFGGRGVQVERTVLRPKVGEGLACLKNGQEAGVAKAKRSSGRVAVDEVKRHI